MQLVKRTEEMDGSSTPDAGYTPSGLAGWAIVLLAKWRAHGWRLRAAERQKTLRLLETLPLGGRRQLLLVSCGGEEFLVGAGADSVSSLLRVRPETSDAEMSAPARRSEPRA